MDGVVRPEAVHVDPAIIVEFPGKFTGEYSMMPGREIAEGIPQGQFLFLSREYILPPGCMVHVRIIGLYRRKVIRYAFPDRLPEFSICHNYISMGQR
jgi:hypothetical protein